MELIYGLEAFPPQRQRVVLAVGTFDGVHRGHQALIADARTRARALGGRCAVLTFDPHPMSVLTPQAAPFLLTTLDERLELFAQIGVDLTVVVRFDDDVRRMSADAWVRTLASRIGMAGVVCGPSYTFGTNREGNPDLLRHLSARHGFQVWVAGQVEVDGEPVSSSRIRTLLYAGQVLNAARLLGRWYGLRGAVVRGDGRGRRLGYPTANIDLPPAKLIPTAGIYAGYARTTEGEFQAAVSIGTRPTFGPGPLQVEAYLLNFAGTLYDRRLEVLLADRLRDELAFTDVADLVRQIASDVTAAQQALLTAADRAGLREQPRRRTRSVG